jgi:hypothetical protein
VPAVSRHGKLHTMSLLTKRSSPAILAHFRDSAFTLSNPVQLNAFGLLLLGLANHISNYQFHYIVRTRAQALTMGGTELMHVVALLYTSDCPSFNIQSSSKILRLDSPTHHPRSPAGVSSFRCPPRRISSIPITKQPTGLISGIYDTYTTGSNIRHLVIDHRKETAFFASRSS